MTYKFEPKTARVGSKHTYVSPSIFFCVARHRLLGVIPMGQYGGYEKDESEGEGLEVHDHEHKRIPLPSVTRTAKIFSHGKD
jgi:hypothetical protein